MKLAEQISHRLRHRFQSGLSNYQELLAPLAELSENSSTLLPGYAASQPGWNKRTDMVPYYHVLGRAAEKNPTRVLLVGGWLGTEEVATYALLRLVAILEQRFQLVDGIEATIYPVINLEARCFGEEKTAAQHQGRFSLWRESEIRPIRVIERELWRYDYDLVISLAESSGSEEFAIHLAGQTAEHGVLVEGIARKHRELSPGYLWQLEPRANPFPPRLTPVPEREVQPLEAALLLPGQLLAEQQAEEAVGLILFLMHEVREAATEEQK